MKIKSEYIMREVCGEYVVVAVGDRTKEFSGMIRLNETGAFLWNKMQKDFTIQALTDALVDAYEVSYDEAENSVCSFVDILEDSDIVE